MRGKENCFSHYQVVLDTEAVADADDEADAEAEAVADPDVVPLVRVPEVQVTLVQCV